MAKFRRTRTVYRSAPRRRRFSRPRFRRFRRKGTQIPLPVVAAAGYPLLRAFNYAGGLATLTSDPMGFVSSFGNSACGSYTGFFPYDGHYELNRLIQTWVPVGIAVVVHATLGKRVNPYIKRIPFLGKYVGV